METINICFQQEPVHGFNVPASVNPEPD